MSVGEKRILGKINWTYSWWYKKCTHCFYVQRNGGWIVFWPKDVYKTFWKHI